MPYKDKLIGIYEISTPNGNTYVGSSRNIFNRWSAHRGELRRGNHHSARLQAAFNKHKDALCYKVLCLCDESMLNFYEQRFIGGLGAKLNTSTFVNNVWANPESRRNLEKVHKSKEWSKQRSEIASRPNARWVSVDSSIGEKFESFAQAARRYSPLIVTGKLLKISS